MRKHLIILAAAIMAACCSNPAVGTLERGEASPELQAGFTAFMDSVRVSLTPPINWMKAVNLHSIMIVKDGKIVEEEYLGQGAPDKPHTMFSVSKTFTATAVGMVISEGKLSLTDKVADYFPDKQVEGNPCNATVEDLLTMAGGHDTDPTLEVLKFDWATMTSSVSEGTDIAAVFFSYPFVHEPGKVFWYNSLGTYLLSAIVTKVTGQSVLDYLTPRLFQPLGIDTPVWDADDNGINFGGWGLHLKTEDMAKMGQLLLQNGKWGKKQLIPATWVKAMGTAHVESAPAQLKPEEADAQLDPALNDWRQGYGYQTWMNTHEGFRADGAGGQYIMVLPQKNAVIIMTSWTGDLQHQLNLVWELIYPNL